MEWIKNNIKVIVVVIGWIASMVGLYVKMETRINLLEAQLSKADVVVMSVKIDNMLENQKEFKIKFETLYNYLLNHP